MRPRDLKDSDERFLVTGACGCIGAWTVHHLLDQGASVVALDQSDNPHRLKLVLTEGELLRLPRAQVDITDLSAVGRTLDSYGITNVIHLAALQVPFCRANPPLGAQVNVVGTVNILEAIASRRARMAPVVYASSIAAYGATDRADDRSPRPDSGIPATLYGVYKRANEAAADVSGAKAALLVLDCVRTLSMAQGAIRDSLPRRRLRCSRQLQDSHSAFLTAADSSFSTLKTWLGHSSRLRGPASKDPQYTISPVTRFT